MSIKNRKLFPILLLVLILAVSISQSAFANSDSNRNVDSRERDTTVRVSDRPLRPERGAPTFTSDEIIVKLKDSLKPIRVRNTRGLEISELVNEYAGRSDVEYAEPNYIAYATYVPNDTYYPIQWNFDNPEYGGVNAETAWDTGSGNGVVVAIIDTGVAYENYGNWWSGRYYKAPDLAGTTFVQGYDFVNNDTHANDDQGHGTHVAGTIAQTTNNNSGTAGLAFNASIMPLKALDSNGSGTYADIADAIRYAADNNADVINMSLSGSQFSSSLESAVNYAYGKGVTIVAAAGNDGRNTTVYPAGYANVISVGATRYNETLAPYSNYGSTIDIVAPGGDTTVDQNGDGNVDGILQQTFGSSRSKFGYYLYQGTSMASPHVAAAAAMIIGAGIASSPDDVRAVLESTADDLGASGKDNKYGNGLLNIATALGASVEPSLPPPDNPPTISITNPVDNDTVSGDVTITADANDDIGIDRVDFYVDSSLVSSDTSTPYSTTWDSTLVSDGTYIITTVAFDTIGQNASSSVSITIDNAVAPLPPPPPVDNPPSVTVTNPNEGDTVSGVISLTADANDDNSVTSVEFYVDGTLKSTDSSSPYASSFDTESVSNGVHAISAIAYDTTGQTASNTVSVTIDNAVVLPPPPPPPASEIVVFSDSFENGLGQWTQDSQNDWRASGQRSTDGSRSVEVDGKAKDATLTSVAIDLQGKTNATITFDWYIERKLDRGEYIAFDVSTDGGASWTNMDSIRGNQDPEDRWFSKEYQLTDISSLQIRFRGKMSKRSEDADVDNVAVTAS